MPIVLLFIIIKKWKPPKFLPIDQRKNKMWFIHTIKNYLATERNELLIHATTRISLEIIRLYEVHKIGKSTERK